MSKIALTGNASGSGTFTLAAPNSDTDRTLTLPDSAGTIATTNGITHMTQFRLTTSYDPGPDDDITANIEEVDDATYSRIGSAVTESSGVFTLPETGVWQVIVMATIGGVDDNNAGVDIAVSTDSGSTFDRVARGYGGQNSGTAGGDSVSANAYVNCTSASTFRVKFVTFSFGNANTELRGETGYSQTSFTFIRIGDAQS